MDYRSQNACLSIERTGFSIDDATPSPCAAVDGAQDRRPGSQTTSLPVSAHSNRAGHTRSLPMKPLQELLSCVRVSDAGRDACAGRASTGAGADRSAAFVERRRAKEGHRRFRADDDHAGQPELRAAGRAHRHLRPGRHALGRAPDVLAGDVHPRARAGAGQGQARAGECRALLDGAVHPERRPRGDRQVDDARSGEAGLCHAHRHVRRRFPGRREEVAGRGQGPALEEGRTPN